MLLPIVDNLGESGNGGNWNSRKKSTAFVFLYVLSFVGFVVGGGVLHGRSYGKSNTYIDHSVARTQAAQAESSFEVRSKIGVRPDLGLPADTDSPKRMPSAPEDPLPRLSLEEMRERINRNGA